MKAFWLIFFILFFKFSFSQIRELTGAIIIGNSEIMSYRITYSIEGDKRVSGFSVSDLNGPAETKAELTGIFNPKQKTLSFSETKIITSKAGLPLSDFCLMKVEGKFIKKDGREIFRGTFTSSSSGKNVICESGTLVLIPTREMYELAAKAAKATKKIPLPDSLRKVVDEKLSPFEGVSDLKNVGAGQVVEYRLKTDTIRLDILDDRLEDGDKVSIIKNKTKVIPEITITNKVQTFFFPVPADEKITVFTIMALNEGYSPPNTVKVIVSFGDKKELLIAQLKEKEYIRLMLKR